ncbi:hypothetical protein DL93DRAFT_2069439, partial [Clavulina sp. PMI_390]
MIERGHCTWIESIWKLCGHRKDQWSAWFFAAMWADCVTTRRTTGYSPYQLMFGKPHLFPFSLDEPTWYTLNWHHIRSTADLLAMRARQLRRLEEDRSDAAAHNVKAQRKAADQYATKHASRLASGLYRVGEYVL